MAMIDLTPEKAWAFESWTNVAYPLAGLFALIFTPISLIWFPVLCLFILGYGSFAYHSTKREYGLYADWIGMFAMFSSIIGIYLSQLIDPNTGWSIGFLIFLMTTILYPYTKEFFVIGILVATTFATGFFVVPIDYFIIGILSFAIAFFIRQYGVKLGGESATLLHGVWHIISALAFMFFLMI